MSNKAAGLWTRIGNFFRQLTVFFVAFLEAAYINLFSLLLLAIIFYFYWEFPQGKDLLLTLNQQPDIEVGFFLATLVVLASVCWYIPRLSYEENTDKPSTETPDDLERNVPSAPKTRGIKRVIEETTEKLKPILYSKMEKHTPEYYSEANQQHVATRGMAMDSDLEGTRGLIQFSPEAENKFDEYKAIFKEHLPRLFGSLVIFIVGFGILNVLREVDHKDDFFALGLLVLVILGMALGGAYFNSGFFKDQLKINSSFNRYLSLGFVIAIAGALIFLLVLMLQNKGDLEELNNLFWATMIIAIGFYIFTVIRKPMVDFYRSVLDKKKDRKKSDRTFNWVLITIFIATTAAAIYFILLNIKPSWSQYLNPLICANLAFIFYISILYYLRVLGARRKIDIVSLFLLIVIVAYAINSGDQLHKVTTVEDQRSINSRASLEEYVDNWVDERREFIEAYLDSNQEKSYPVFIISSEGGGSRAAYWTIRTHMSFEEANEEYFDHHLFALTGASGGNTGNSTYFSMKEAGFESDSILAAARKMFLQNYLSSSLTLFLGADQWRNMVGAGGQDRAKELEREWTAELAKVTDQKVNTWHQPLLDFWYESGQDKLQLKEKLPPLLLINTTHVQKGGHGIFSPVKVNDTFYKGKDLLRELKVNQPDRSIPLKTANLLNASFPYVNPAGIVEGSGSYVDAGYYDNFGANTAISLINQLKAYRDRPNTDSLIKQLSFVSVLIRNSTVDGDPETGVDLTPYQLRAPLKTLGGIRSAVNSHNRWELSKIADQSYEVNLLPRQEIKVLNNGEEISPVVPLARYLSYLAIDAMDASMESLEQVEVQTDRVQPLNLNPGGPALEIEKRSDLQQIKQLLKEGN